MLDQNDYIKRYDQHDILGVVYDQFKQLTQVFELPDLSHLAKVKSIVFAGMGGSALSGEFIKSWLGDRLEIPLIVTRGYDLPNFVGKDTLVIASSYSGNTEETISCLNQAIKRKAKILCLSTGGMIEEIAVDSKLAYIKLPSGIQPRLATLYGVKALCDAIEAIGWLDGLVSELSATAKWVELHLSSWTASTPTESNPAKQLANAFFGHPLVIYGGPTLSLISMKWKISSNENAKNLAFYNYLPEFNHNEFLGWGHPAKTSLRVVQLQSSLDSSQVKKRFEVSNRLLSGSMPEPIVIHAKGESKLDQMVWAIILGDFAMSYLAFLNQIDPTPVPLIEKLKREIAQ